MTDGRLLTTDEVARRLGVKKATVYAYVSRGLLVRRRNGSGKESLFAEADVTAFGADRRPTVPGTEATSIHTGITLIADGHLHYRGHDACILARTASYESVVTLLWTGELEDFRFDPDPALRELAEAVTAPLPPQARLTDRLRVIVAAIAAADRLRFDTSAAAVATTGRTIISTMVSALPRRAFAVEGTTAAELWSRLTTLKPTPARIAALNSALILLADHDLAASTFAARVAASTRAHPYAVVGAGLAALDGPLHGAASTQVIELLNTAVRTADPVGTISDRLRTAGTVPGFGHPLYPGGDPRAATLLDILARLPAASRSAHDVIAGVADAMTQRSGIKPNIDFALAAFALLHDMNDGAGEAIFAIARTAGWLAHALEEYENKPGRFRPNGQYQQQAG
ncbi:citrate synthase [Winogradskya consettensis]|uniref:citrate synthase (unknown stereospecificity) n=1 Tax=Winogradskya consettensis TaxID=113560 RepID=A0A919VN49_9ACTN|nr:citrate synthase family protein [Actinoplanes consettensis]GIM69565.1 citrate synthase [Actinoplanes consettensis]